MEVGHRAVDELIELLQAGRAAWRAGRVGELLVEAGRAGENTGHDALWTAGRRRVLRGRGIARGGWGAADECENDGEPKRCSRYQASHLSTSHDAGAFA